MKLKLLKSPILYEGEFFLGSFFIFRYVIKEITE